MTLSNKMQMASTSDIKMAAKKFDLIKINGKEIYNRYKIKSILTFFSLLKYDKIKQML